ncbi:MAG: MptD family putative ECF transporter S component [Lachnospiraceae bacterium]|nr:MptD family putative ECF transporter S component [Lachnospiraceae bacterium]
MKKISVVRLLIAAVIYTALFVLGSSCGLIHPACYAYVGTVIPLLFSFVYLYTAAGLRTFGAAAILNGVALIIGLIAGEGNPALITGMIILALLAELIRRMNGYETLKGVRRSFIPLAFSFYAYSAHWWTNTEESLAAAVEEMPAGYADKMEAVVQNIPVLILMLVLTIPVAVLGMKIAEKVLKKQAVSLE